MEMNPNKDMESIVVQESKVEAEFVTMQDLVMEMTSAWAQDSAVELVTVSV